MDTLEDRMNAIAASKAMQAAQTFGALLYPGGVLTNVANQGYFNNLIDPIKQLRNSQMQAAAEYAAQVAPSSQPAPAVVASAPQATQEVIPLPDQPQQQAPEIPAGWTRERYVGEPVAPETAYAISPQERSALEQGYMPPRVEAVQPAQVAPAVAAAQVAPEAQVQPAAPARRLETTPAVDSYFEEVTKNLPPRFRQIAAMEAQFQAQRRNELQQAANNIELANQAEHKRIERGIAQLPEDAGQYSGTVHNINRARAMADMNKELALAELSTRGMEPTAAAERMKSARETIKDKYADAITPFEKTEQYKAASQEATRISKDLQKQLKFTNEIGILKKYINEGKIDDAAKFAKSTVAQSMNSLTSDNAIQTTEMLIRYPSLLSKFDLNKLQGKPALANLLSNVIEGTITKDKEQQLQDALSKDKGVLDQLIEYAARTNPQAFLKNAIDTANANTRSLNETMVNRIIRPTSPGIAHKLGIGELPQIAHLSEEENQPQQSMQQAAPDQGNKFGSMKLPGGGVATWRSKK